MLQSLAHCCHVPIKRIKDKEAQMSKPTITQHEVHLKNLEKSIEKICDACIEMERAAKDLWNIGMRMLVITEELRKEGM